MKEILNIDDPASSEDIHAVFFLFFFLFFFHFLYFTFLLRLRAQIRGHLKSTSFTKWDFLTASPPCDTLLFFLQPSLSCIIH